MVFIAAVQSSEEGGLIHYIQSHYVCFQVGEKAVFDKGLGLGRRRAVPKTWVTSWGLKRLVVI